MFRPAAPALHPLAPNSLDRETLEREVADHFRPLRTPTSGPGRVGVEVEWIPAVPGADGPPRPLTVAETDLLLARDPQLRGDARVSFEPGGQLEFSPEPSASVAQLLEDLGRLTRRVERCLEPAGGELFVSGLNPWHSCDRLGLQTPAPRYVSMQRHFDSIGPFGRRMMRQSLALQVSLDLGEPRDSISRWRLANLAGPPLAAAFANSPLMAGAATGITGARSQAWQLLDPGRTGFDGAQVGDPAPPAYSGFARAASYIDIEVLSADPGAAVSHHLSTLFPPVRPRGFLEVRFLDALPRRWMAVPIITLAALLYDRAATAEALDALAATEANLSTWRRSCEQGVRDPDLAASALALLAIARRAVERFTAGYFPADAVTLLAEFEARFTAARRCPADEQLESFTRNPEDLNPWK
jgi:glutamate--cysteine ligase